MPGPSLGCNNSVLRLHMADPLYANATLSVSGTGDIDCKEMVRALEAAGVHARASQTVSSVPGLAQGCALTSQTVSSVPGLEQGCALTSSVSSKEDVRDMWTVVRAKYDFECAHLAIGGVFSGCIHDFLRPSICPGRRFGLVAGSSAILLDGAASPRPD